MEPSQELHLLKVIKILMTQKQGLGKVSIRVGELSVSLSGKFNFVYMVGFSGNTELHL
jgi:hypothetical protein